MCRLRVDSLTGVVRHAVLQIRRYQDTVLHLPIVSSLASSLIMHIYSQIIVVDEIVQIPDFTKISPILNLHLKAAGDLPPRKRGGEESAC